MVGKGLYLAVLGGLRVAVDRREVVGLLGVALAVPVDAGDVEEFLVGAFHGLRRGGVSRTAAARVCSWRRWHWRNNASGGWLGDLPVPWDVIAARTCRTIHLLAWQSSADCTVSLLRMRVRQAP